MYLVDPIDEYAFQHMADFDGHKLQALTKEGLKFSDEDEETAKKRTKVKTCVHACLCVFVCVLQEIVGSIACFFLCLLLLYYFVVIIIDMLVNCYNYVLLLLTGLQGHFQTTDQIYEGSVHR